MKRKMFCAVLILAAGLPRGSWGQTKVLIVQSWFYTGLFRALSSPERPLLLISYEGRGMQQANEKLAEMAKQI